MPGRASSRRGNPIRPGLVQVGAMRPGFATLEAPRVRFRVIFRDARCSKPRTGIGTPQGVKPAQIARQCTKGEATDLNTTTAAD